MISSGNTAVRNEIVSDSARSVGSRPQVSCKSRVALLGPYHSRNLGDTAIQIAVIQNLLERRPDLHILGVSIDPADTTRSLGIPAFPLSGCGPNTLSTEDGVVNTDGIRNWEGAGGLISRLRALPRIAAFAGTIDLLIISGGGQIDDFWGGAWGHPYTLFAWVALARLRGTRVVFIGIGLDRLSNPLSKFFALSALRLAQYRAFRDGGTLTELQSMGLRAESRTCPDLAFSLKREKFAAAVAESAAEPFAVISPISERTWARGSDKRHENYLQQLVLACEWLSNHGLRLHIVCSQAKMDGETAKQLATLLKNQHGICAEIHDAPTVAEFLGEVCNASVVIASRLHAAILSLVAGAPVVALAPLRKVTQLMDDVALSNYCLDLQNLTGTDLIRCIASALENGPHLRSNIQGINEVFGRDLEAIYDEIVFLA